MTVHGSAQSQYTVFRHVIARMPRLEMLDLRFLFWPENENQDVGGECAQHGCHDGCGPALSCAPVSTICIHVEQVMPGESSCSSRANHDAGGLMIEVVCSVHPFSSNA